MNSDPIPLDQNHTENMEENNTMRIVLLGKTGAGKSSLTNTIFGEKVFKESGSPNSETKECQTTKTKEINGRNIKLIDTPGLFDTDLNSTELSPEILKCIKETAPGPHAFLIVLKVERYTKQEQDVVDKILKYFPEEALKYTTLVFTHGDQLETGKGIKEWVRENKALKTLVQKCGGRCHVFDNKYWNNSQDQYRNNQYQVQELLKTMEETTTEKNWKYYTNKFLKFVINNLKEIWSRITDFAAGVLLGALLGAEELAGALFGKKLSRQSSEKEEAASLCQHVPDNNTTRIVLLGKSGSGKSSLANTIFGKYEFQVRHSPFPGRKSCQSVTRTVNGRNIKLIDPPGLFDTDPESSELSPEILRCITESAPGPHAFLLVLKVEKFTKQEQAVVELILKYFSEEALKYTTVVFTHGDLLPEGMNIEEWVSHTEALKNLVQKCGGRCHVFDNKYWNNSQDEYRNNQYQVQELLKTIDKTVRENGGGCYTNEMLQKVEEIQKEADLIKATSLRDASPKDKSFCTIF